MAVAGILSLPTQVLALSVNTNDIVDGAVTDAKITGPISGSKLGAHAHNGSDIVNGTITSGKIADGAVTNAKISGTIGVEKVAVYSGEKIVHKGIADGVNTFNSIQTAIDSITDASENNPYLIKVMPGVFVGSVTLKPYVRIDGSGKDNTIITIQSDINNYTISCADNTSINSVTVKYDNTIQGSVLTLQQDATVSLEQVKIVMPNNVYVPAISGTSNNAVTLNNVHILLESGTTNGADLGIVMWNSNNRYINIKNSFIEMNSGTTNVAVAALVESADTNISDTDIKVTSSSGEIEALDVGSNVRLYNCRINVNNINPGSAFQGMSGKFEIYNSTITVSGAVTYAITLYEDSVINNSTIVSGQNGIDMRANVKINNSVLSTAGTALNKQYGSFKIGNSQLIGSHNGVVGIDRIKNCYDINYDAVPEI